MELLWIINLPLIGGTVSVNQTYKRRRKKERKKE
jgi:hypothetical protein